jgi:hypothetical protein
VDSTELGWDDIKFTPLTDDELYLLNLFHEKVAQIASSSFIKNGAFKSAFTFYADKSKNKFSLSHLGPEEADVRSILVLVRPVTLLHEMKMSEYESKESSINCIASPQTIKPGSIFKL